MSERKSDPDREDSERAFFGRRKGHKLRQHQAELIDHLLPRLALAIDSEAPADAREIFAPAVDDLRLEIGFGGGEHLAAEAQSFATTGFIGCEPYVNGMAKILAQIEAANIGNIRLFAGDAAELLAWLPKASLSRIDLIHPDPWPKRRHHRRRIVTLEFLDSIHAALEENSLFHIATDHLDYFRKIEETARSTSGFAIAEVDVELPPSGFELIFREQGAPIHWLALRKVSPVR